jgi:hypothetical protein
MRNLTLRWDDPGGELTMIEDNNKHPAAEMGSPLPANDNAAGDGAQVCRHLHTALVPLVRFLARQVARDWLKQAANDNRPDDPAERPSKE